MLPQNSDLNGIRACYGKSWNPQDKDCRGGRVEHATGGTLSPPCDMESSCKISFAHKALEGIIPGSQLNRATRPTAVSNPITHTPPAYTPQPQAQAARPAAMTPAAHPLQPAAPQQAAQPHPFSVPMAQGGHATTAPVHYNPVAHYSPGFLTSSEPKGKHSKGKRLVTEVARGGLKGMAMQFAHFIDVVSWLDDD